VCFCLSHNLKANYSFCDIVSHSLCVWFVLVYVTDLHIICFDGILLKKEVEDLTDAVKDYIISLITIIVSFNTFFIKNDIRSIVIDFLCTDHNYIVLVNVHQCLCIRYIQRNYFSVTCFLFISLAITYSPFFVIL
jgi:hypothetical protein